MPFPLFISLLSFPLLASNRVIKLLFKMFNKIKLARKEERETLVEIGESSILDLPELTLECVLERLSPVSLAKMSCVCVSLRDRCRDDHLWERHMREKWSVILGIAVETEWELYRKNSSVSCGSTVGRMKSKSWIESLSCLWPLSWIITSQIDTGDTVMESQTEADSIMSWYLALESGKFWFPAQVFNRENGHVGFLLSCYDAHLSYDRQTNTFFARYPPHGRKPVKTEEGVQWERIRAPLVSTPAHELHISDCLKDLHPGDHFEIQWRKNKEFPYGWWYGVVGHLESCNDREYQCRCHEDDTIILEFKQYAPGSRWRRAAVSRKDHREKGDETDGFYGGIRKLKSNDEIKMWKRFWPTEILE